jgi:hypothetical protein
MFSNRYASPVEQPRRYEKLMNETLRLASMKTKREAIELSYERSFVCKQRGRHPPVSQQASMAE